MNKVILIGRLTVDPDMTVAQSGTSVCKFSLAVDRRFHKDGQPTADFIRCTAFGKTAEFIDKYFKKGNKMAVEGSIQTGSYTNKENQKVYTTDVMIESVEFVESKKTEQTAEPESTPFD